jgi:hypothetical protein
MKFVKVMAADGMEAIVNVTLIAYMKKDRGAKSTRVYFLNGLDLLLGSDEDANRLIQHGGGAFGD